MPVIAVFGNNKSLTFYGSGYDSEALCYPEGGDIEFNRIRYSDQHNQLFIHTKIGDCNESILLACIEANKIDSCKPKKSTLESFKVITNPYDEPSINIYLNNGVPDEFKEAFKNSRKLSESKVK